jgi:heme exporter protein B
MNPWRVILTIAAKDWRIEGRARDVLTATVFFAGLVVMILAFAFGPETTRLREAAPGVLWVAIAFSSILAASRAFASEAEDGALEALLLYPVPHELIYLGKLLSNVGLMLMLALLVTPLTVLLYAVNVANAAMLALTVFLGVIGFSIIATFQSSLTVNLRARESLLPVLIFPLVVPVVIGAVKATTLIVTNGSGIEIWGWLRLLIGFNIVYVTVCTLVFPFAVES